MNLLRKIDDDVYGPTTTGERPLAIYLGYDQWSTFCYEVNCLVTTWVADSSGTKTLYKGVEVIQVKMPDYYRVI